MNEQDAVETTIKSTPVFGVTKQLPLAGWPPGRVRLRLRNDNYAQAFVRLPGSGIRRFYVSEREGKWWPDLEFGANLEAAQ